MGNPQNPPGVRVRVYPGSEHLYPLEKTRTPGQGYGFLWVGVRVCSKIPPGYPCRALQLTAMNVGHTSESFQSSLDPTIGFADNDSSTSTHIHPLDFNLYPRPLTKSWQIEHASSGSNTIPFGHSERFLICYVYSIQRCAAISFLSFYWHGWASESANVLFTL